MKLRLLVSISLLTLALCKARAQSADDFFHSGARSYLSNNIPGAQELVDKGLKLYPDDIKLKKLDELLKQQKQQQQQQQNQQQNQQQQQQNQLQQNQSQSKQDQQKQSQEQKQKEQQQKQQQENQQKQQQKQGDDQDQQEQQAAAGQMNPEQAKQLMDQAKADELLLPNSRKEKPHNQDHPIKDW